MKTILILGATSKIGRELCKLYSRENRVIISGRNIKLLKDVEAICLEGAICPTIIAEADLSNSIAPILNANSIWPIDLIIDASSGATKARDSSTSIHNIGAIIQSDLISPNEITQALSKINEKHPDILFISTVLAEIKTANREIYSAIKRLREIYLEKAFQEHKNTTIVIIRLGKFRRADEVARKVMNLFTQSQKSKQFKIMRIGIDSLILYTLHSIHPFLSSIFVKITRALTNGQTGH